MPRVLIIGGGFAGLNAAKGLGGIAGIEVTLVDRTNHHLFQPLLYQVAMAGLSPADIALPSAQPAELPIGSAPTCADRPLGPGRFDIVLDAWEHEWFP